MIDYWKSIGDKLEQHHALFYKFWQLGKPVFTDSVDTAAVVFNKEGKCINFLFNENFWNECDEYKKLFVICHECLHVVLNHGSRFKDCDQKRIANVAQDIVINHLLCESFGFIKTEIQDWEKYCWVDTVFKGKQLYGRPYPTDESSEFYYVQLLKEQDKAKNKDKGQGQGKGQDKDQGNSDEKSDSDSGSKSDDGLPSTVDNHDKWSDDLDNPDLIKDVIESLSDEDIQVLKDKLQNQISKSFKAGTALGCVPFLVVKPNIIIKKQKWETVIKKWEKIALRHDEFEIEQWIRLPRRFSCIETELFIPSDEIVEDIRMKKDKIDVFFFMDTSGSCIHLKDRFFAAALTLDPKKFNIRLFCFDTRVVETDIKGQQVYGGGGTSFSIIEDHIKSIVNQGNKYPAAVFVITDGYGTHVNPQFPNRWHWFLSTEYKNLIPKKSHSYQLEDFE
jgi:predicted metal-dependent peptidase